ncbi:MAG: DUF4097 domain-containing protein [Defluviitaleaceae bacterium]|nr:DUF4097 domain-containing protein [Defluviitaleaceae bacterium]
MASEKMTILQMLQDGKITADEATNLLTAIESGGSGGNATMNATPPIPPTLPRPPEPPMSGIPPIPPVPPMPHSSASASVNNSNNPPPHGYTEKPKSGVSVDFDEIGRKFAAFAKDLEPKIQKAVEFTAEKTVFAADKLSKTIETGVKNFEKGREERAAAASRAAAATTMSPAKPTMPTTKTGGTEQRIEMVVADGYNELNLSSLNGDVKIIGYNGDKISATIRYQANRSSATIDLMQLGNKYYLNYAEEDFKFVSIDAYVPSQKFHIVNIGGVNGNMDLLEISCSQIQISNTNGQTTLKQLSAQNINSDTSNGRLTISHIAANEAVFEHCNGAIEIDEADVEKFSITNFNGFISMVMSNFNNFGQYLWRIETSNAKLNLNLPTLPNLGYHLKAQSSLGDVRIGLTGLQSLVSEQGFVEAKTLAFDSKAKQVRLDLETSNAPLTVN